MTTGAIQLERKVPGAKWIQAYLVFVFVCQVLLLAPQLGPARVLLRTAAFGASVALALLLRPRGRVHPAWWTALVILGIMGVELFHPTTNTFLAGLAETSLYASILAPLLWVAGVDVDEKGFRGMIRLLWGFHAAGALVGVMQVYFPGRFEPHLSSVIIAQGDWYVRDLHITLANGAWVFRPMGLTDVPGGAANAGFYAVLLGGCLLVAERNWMMRAACAASMLMGLFCLYLSQVRVLLVMTGICLIVFMGLMFLRGEGRKVIGLAMALVLAVALSLTWAISIGGAAATKRLESLIADDPGAVYYSNRGHFLQDTVTRLLPQYPLGAGLGRWGMMYYYFGNKNDPHSEMIWAEIMWTGWLLDGGIPLVAAYIAAMGIAFYWAGRIALDRTRPDLTMWGALVFAYNTGALAVTFNNPLFVSQAGLEFWLLNAALWGAWLASPTSVPAALASRISRKSRYARIPQPATRHPRPMLAGGEQ
jgi:hypothetical protein